MSFIQDSLVQVMNHYESSANIFGQKNLRIPYHVLLNIDVYVFIFKNDF